MGTGMLVLTILGVALVMGLLGILLAWAINL